MGNYMLTLSKEISILLIGWLLGLISSIVLPFIHEYIKNWLSKRELKKLLKIDVEMKLEQLKRIENRINYSSNYESLDDVVDHFRKYINMKEYAANMRFPPVIYDKISIDLYIKNRSKIINYFNEEKQLLNFYERISTLNSLVDAMEKNKPEFEKFIDYCMHLKYTLNEGNRISI